MDPFGYSVFPICYDWKSPIVSVLQSPLHISFGLICSFHTLIDRLGLLGASTAFFRHLGWAFLDLLAAAALGGSDLYFHLLVLACEILQLHLAQLLHFLVIQRIQMVLRADVAGVTAEDETDDAHAAAALLARRNRCILVRQEARTFLVSIRIIHALGAGLV